MDSERETSSSIMRRITQTQYAMDQSRYRISVLEKCLKLKDMTADEREKMEKELQDIKKILTENEAVLASLHGENRKTVSLAAIVFVACFFGYCLYSLFVNPH